MNGIYLTHQREDIYPPKRFKPERFLERQFSPIDDNVEAAQLAFEINALFMGANWALQLHGDQQAFARARAAILQRLRSVATDRSPRLDKEG